jgi:hypothetical protein
LTDDSSVHGNKNVSAQEYDSLGCDAIQFRDSPVLGSMFLKPSRKSIEANWKVLLLGYLVGLLFNPEAGGNMFLLNIRFCKLHGITLQKTVLFTAVLTHSIATYSSDGAAFGVVALSNDALHEVWITCDEVAPGFVDVHHTLLPFVVLKFITLNINL